jgi:hypothetical protein
MQNPFPCRSKSIDHLAVNAGQQLLARLMLKYPPRREHREDVTGGTPFIRGSDVVVGKGKII